MLDDVLAYLACPQCGASMSRPGAAPGAPGAAVLSCRRGHSFDIARQGYVSLLPAAGRSDTGDSAAMVAARADFLAAGHYAGLARELARAAADVTAGAHVPGCVADVGAGPGYYLAVVLERLPGRAGLALDSSRFALRRAARAHPRLGAVGADAWHRLPVADGAAAVVLNVFAPRNGAELRRILDPAGRLLVVTPRPEHLGELTGPLRLLDVDPRKEERLSATLTPYFELAEQRPYRAILHLGHQAMAAVVAMGPSARHVDPGVLAEQIRRLPTPLPVTVSVTLSIFRPVA